MDRAGNRLCVTESRSGQTDRVLIYTYDHTHQLLSETDGTVSTVFTYDDAGNRLTKTVGGTVTNYSSDKLNRVLSAVTGSDTISYTYDSNGNRASKTANSATQTYTYDRENRLVLVSDGTSNIFTAVYDYRTRRMDVVENGVETKYVYDGGDCAQEWNADGSLKTKFVRGTSLGGGIGGVLYDEKTGVREFFCYNAIGSTMANTDANGAIVSSNSYDAWGKIVNFAGSSSNNRLFCTKERSVSIGLDNFGKRYFDYELGRFVTRDPAGYPDGENNYLYCSNNPINKIDPLGLWEKYVADKTAEKVEEATQKLADKVKDIPYLGGETSAKLIAAAGGYGASIMKKTGAAMEGPNYLDQVLSATSDYLQYKADGQSTPEAAYNTANLALNPAKGMVEGATNTSLEPSQNGKPVGNLLERGEVFADSLGATTSIIAGAKAARMAVSKVKRTPSSGADLTVGNPVMELADGTLVAKSGQVATPTPNVFTHGTSAARMESIMKYGFDANKVDMGNVWASKGAGPWSGGQYSAFAPEYAANAAMQDGTNPVLIQIKIPSSKMSKVGMRDLGDEVGFDAKKLNQLWKTEDISVEQK